jgi:hypothetical protein
LRDKDSLATDVMLYEQSIAKYTLSCNCRLEMNRFKGLTLFCVDIQSLESRSILGVGNLLVRVFPKVEFRDYQEKRSENNDERPECRCKAIEEFCARRNAESTNEYVLGTSEKWVTTICPFQTTRSENATSAFIVPLPLGLIHIEN